MSETISPSQSRDKRTSAWLTEPATPVPDHQYLFSYSNTAHSRQPRTRVRTETSRPLDCQRAAFLSATLATETRRSVAAGHI